MILEAVRDLTLVVLVIAGVVAVVAWVLAVFRARGIVIGAAGPEAASLAGCGCESCTELSDLLGAPGPFVRHGPYISPSTLPCPRCGAEAGHSCIDPEHFPVYLYCNARVTLRNRVRDVSAPSFPPAGNLAARASEAARERTSMVGLR